MPHPQNDADVERLVQHSAAFRAVRAGLEALDALAARSASARALPRRLSRRSVGVLLLIAGVTHGVLESLLPASTAPAGVYTFAVSSALLGALLAGLPQSE